MAAAVFYEIFEKWFIIKLKQLEGTVSMKKFYCYNRCLTCAKARKWLNENHVAYEEIDIVKNPPTADFLLKLITAGQHPLKYFFNTSGIKYRQLGLKDKVANYRSKKLVSCWPVMEN